jgi:hypothetical protein
MKQMLAARLIKASVLVNDLYGHIAVQDLVIGAIDNAHPAFADLRDDTTMTENSADHNSLPPRPC